MRGTLCIGAFRNAATVITTALFLGACLMQDKIEDDDLAFDAAIEADFELSGSVGDGPVVGAAMRIMQNDGMLLSELESDASAGYNIVVKTKGKYYPLMVDARGGIDIVTNLAPDFVLIGAALEPNKQYVVNVNPYSTLAMEIATDLPGGRTKTNIYTAQAIAVASMNNGLVSLVGKGPMTTKIDSSNVAEIVKTSEALGEIVRRTRDWLLTAGFIWDGDAVIGAMGSDLIDNVIDGAGGPRTNALMAAIASIVTAQVLLESMSNELYVNGTDATASLESAIQVMNLGTASPALGELNATSGMLAQINVGLAAADAISDDVRVSSLRQSAAGFQPGMQPILARSVLTPDYRQILDDVLRLLIAGDATTIATVNEVVRNGGDIPGDGTPPGTNTPPAIEIIADNLDANTVQTGTWIDSQNANPYLSNSVYCVSGCLFTWQPVLPISATYEVYVYWTYHPQRTTTASYQIDHDGGTDSRVVNQRDSSSSNQWYLIGTYNLTAGVNGNVSLSYDESESGVVSVLADAVRYVLVSEGLPDFAPQISGTPSPSVNVGQGYSFTPTAADLNGDNLTFSIQNKPSWATFSSSTGQLSGTPQVGDAGTYANISISVSDGNLSDTLPNFTITVNQVSLGSATLNWTPPTQNTDGTALTDLAGYRLFWGPPGNRSNSVTINNPGLTSYVVDNLAPGTYEFVATAFNAVGMDSQYSNSAIKTVQ